MKGKMPNFTAPGYFDSDNIHTEDVDYLCGELGEWYRGYREDNLKVRRSFPAFAAQSAKIEYLVYRSECVCCVFRILGVLSFVGACRCLRRIEK